MPIALMPSFASSAAGFSPASISGLTLWLKADAGVFSDAGLTLATDGQNVQQWNDQSGNGKNATQLTAGKRPIYRSSINNNPALEFSHANSSQLLVGGNADFVNTAFTIFIVSERQIASANLEILLAKADAVTAAHTVWEVISREANANPADPNGYLVTFSTGYGAGTVNGDTTMITMVAQDLACAKRVSNSSKVMYRNGLQTNTGGDSGNALNAGATPVGVGNDGGTGGNGFNGWIKEILYYNSALSDTDRNNVEQYLRQKWSIFSKVFVTFPTGPTFPATKMSAFQSLDIGQTFSTIPGVTNPVYTFQGPNGVGTSTNTQTCSVLFYNNTYWVCHEVNVNFTSSSSAVSFNIAKTTNWPSGPWTFVTSPVVFGSLITGSFVWDPRWYVLPDGTIRIVVMASNNLAVASNSLYIMTPNDPGTFMSWQAPVLLTGSGFAVTGAFDEHCIIMPQDSPNGLYNLFYTDTATNKLHWFSSSSFGSGYSFVKNDPFGNEALGVNGNNVNLYKVNNNCWRVYLSPEFDLPPFYMESVDGWNTWQDNPNVQLVGGNPGSIWLGTGQLAFSLAGRALGVP